MSLTKIMHYFDSQETSGRPLKITMSELTIDVTMRPLFDTEKDYPPVARAGNDLVIVLPVNQVTLYANGSTDDKVRNIYKLWPLLLRLRTICQKLMAGLATP